MTHHDQSLRHYLLAKLGQPETESLEGDLLEDSGLFERADAVNGELVMDLVAGKLPEDEARILENRLGTVPGGARERRFHQLLSDRLPNAANSNERAPLWPRSPGLSALVAALLTLAVSALLFKPLGPVGPGTEATSPSDGTAVSVAPIKASFIVEPLTRSNSASSPLGIEAGTELVGLWLVVPAATDEDMRVAVQTGGESVRYINDPELVRQSWGTYLSIEIEAAALPQTALDLLVEQRRGEEWVAVASYSVPIGKK